MNSEFPIGVCKQACMKLDSFITDINEMKCDSSISEETKSRLNDMLEAAGSMEACLVNIVHKECGDEDGFLNESIEMDDCGSYDQESEELNVDLMDMPVE